MLTYIPYSFLFFIIHGVASSPERNSRGATYYLMFYAVSTIVSHTVSIWLTVSVAMFRYIYLSAHNGKLLCTLFRAKVTVAAVIVASIVMNIPQLLILRIHEFHDERTNLTRFILQPTGLASHNAQLQLAQAIIMAVLVKIGPSVLLTFLSASLIRIILKAQKKYQKMQSLSKGSLHLGPNEKKRQEQTNQTTKLLIAVAIVFTVAELPQGILFCLNRLSGEYQQLYYKLGNLMDLVTMVSCSINFVLYCSMSHQFRKIFVSTINGSSLRLTKCRGSCCRQPFRNISTSLSTEMTAVSNHRSEEEEEENFVKEV